MSHVRQSKGLRMLEDVALLQSDRVGRDRRIEMHRLAEIREYLDQNSEQWEARLERLRTFLADDIK